MSKLLGDSRDADRSTFYQTAGETLLAIFVSQSSSAELLRHSDVNDFSIEAENVT